MSLILKLLWLWDQIVFQIYSRHKRYIRAPLIQPLFPQTNLLSRLSDPSKGTARTLNSKVLPHRYNSFFSLQSKITVIKRTLKTLSVLQKLNSKNHLLEAAFNLMLMDHDKPCSIHLIWPKTAVKGLPNSECLPNTAPQSQGCTELIMWPCEWPSCSIHMQNKNQVEGAFLKAQWDLNTTLTLPLVRNRENTPT